LAIEIHSGPVVVESLKLDDFGNTAFLYRPCDGAGQAHDAARIDDNGIARQRRRNRLILHPHNIGVRAWLFLFPPELCSRVWLAARDNADCRRRAVVTSLGLGDRGRLVETGPKCRCLVEVIVIPASEWCGVGRALLRATRAQHKAVVISSIKTANMVPPFGSQLRTEWSIISKK
jgi:hypothetical protein